LHISLGQPLPQRVSALLSFCCAGWLFALSRCRHRQAAANVALLRCRNRRSCRAAATALPPSRCAPPPRCRLGGGRPVALTPPLLPPPPRRRLLGGCCVVIALPPPPHRRQAAADLALSRCRHRLAAAKLPPTSRCRADATAVCCCYCVPPSKGGHLRPRVSPSIYFFVD
jgi:hypothetical protein